MDKRFEIFNVIQMGLTSNFTGGKVQCFLALKPISHREEMCFEVKFDKSRDYAEFSEWLKQLLDKGDELQAIQMENRVVMIGRGDDYKSNWYLSYKDGGGGDSNLFPEYIIRNINRL